MESGNTQPRVGILMSSYNGERFLPMLMDSLLRQDACAYTAAATRLAALVGRRRNAARVR